MKKSLTLLFLVLFWLTLKAQITNSTKSDNSNIYIYTADSVIKIIERLKSTEKIIITGLSPDFFKSFRNRKDLTIVEKNRKHYPNTIWIRIGNLYFENGIFSIPVRTLKETKRKKNIWGDGSYTFKYKCNLPDSTFTLFEIEKGITL